MLKNYLKIAFRNLGRHKTFSFINIAGLSISLAFVLLIAAYAQFEMGMNKFNKNYDRIYKVGEGDTPAPVAELIKSNLPQIKEATRIQGGIGFTTIKYGEKVMIVKNVIYSDPDFFNVFTFPAIKGNPQAALAQPMSLVLTESEAERIFGNADPIDKVVEMNNAYDLTVRAVIEDVPQNSSLQFDGVISFASLKRIQGSPTFNPYDWYEINYETYVLFPRECNGVELASQIKSLVLKNMPPADRGFVNPEAYPFKNVYYNAELSSFSSHGSMERDFALISIGALILLVAMINYINLSTARVSTRNKETGVRKTIGASRASLIIQFLSESVVISVVSMIAAVLIAMVLVELFRQFIDSRLSLFPDFILLRAIVFLAFAIVVGVLSGIYPAFFLTSFEPNSILKGDIHHGQGKAFLRKSLIVFQFAITIVLLASTIVIYSQLGYMKNKPLGFQKNNIVYFWINKEIYQQRDAFKTKMLSLSSIEDFAYSYSVPGSMGMQWSDSLGYKGMGIPVIFNSVPTTSEFIRLMGMKIIEGRNFIPNDTNDVNNVIVNQAFARKYGLQEPLSAEFPDYGKDRGKIVGVVKDFNFQSLRSPVTPLAFIDMPDLSWNIGCGVIKMRSSSYADIKSTIDGLTATWREFSPDFPVQYYFLDQALAREYRSDDQFETAFFWFSLFAIFITCLGLFGLTAYTVEQRTKEISVRKILGATVTGITFMLSKQFVMLLLISNVIAWPVAYYVTNRWLRDFAYRIDFSLWIFVMSAAIALAVALLTVSFQTIKAATANPVEALRYE